MYGCVGQTVVFVGGSTTRHLANHLILSMARALNMNFSRDAEYILNRKIPGWQLHDSKCDETKGFGCLECFCSSRLGHCPHHWVDFEAVHASSSTRIVFSWKPDLFRDSDAVAFYTRILPLKTGILFVGKGLHDATFDNKAIMKDQQRIKRDIWHLQNMVLRTAKGVKIFMRTPYRSRKQSENSAIRQIRDHQLHTWSSSSRINVIDGYNITEGIEPYDSHHYGHDVHETVLHKICEGG